MTRTVVDETDDLDTAHRFHPSKAVAGIRLSAREAERPDYSCLAGAGAFVSTPTDLVRLGSAMLKPGLLKAETLAALQTPSRLVSGASATYALGWTVATVQLAGEPARMYRSPGQPDGRNRLAPDVSGSRPRGCCCRQRRASPGRQPVGLTDRRGVRQSSTSLDGASTWRGGREKMGRGSTRPPLCWSRPLKSHRPNVEGKMAHGKQRRPRRRRRPAEHGRAGTGLIALRSRRRVGGGRDQLVHARSGHRRVAFGDERAIAAAGFGARQAGDPRELAADGQSRRRRGSSARSRAARHLAATRRRSCVGEAADAERPDVGELRPVERPRSGRRASPPGARRSRW